MWWSAYTHKWRMRSLFMCVCVETYLCAFNLLNVCIILIESRGRSWNWLPDISNDTKEWVIELWKRTWERKRERDLVFTLWTVCVYNDVDVTHNAQPTCVHRLFCLILPNPWETKSKVIIPHPCWYLCVGEFESYTYMECKVLHLISLYVFHICSHIHKYW